MNNTKNFRSKFVSIAPCLYAMVVLFATTTLFASNHPSGSFERTLQVSGPVNLDVSTHSGDVTVHVGGAGSVVIRGKISVGDHWLMGGRENDVHSIEQNPPIHQDGNQVHIENVNMHEISIDYDVTVPAETSVHTRSGSGDQSIEGTHGNVDVQTGSGDVKLRSIIGAVQLQTGSGDVRAHEVSGAVKGGTGSGDVELEETGTGDVDLRAGSGNITVRGIQGGFHGETGSGDVTAEGTQNGNWEIRSGSGNVHVRLPGNAAFDADFATSSGSIDVNSPIEMTVQGRVEEQRHRVEGKVRGGGALLRIRTGSGDIHIE